MAAFKKFKGRGFEICKGFEIKNPKLPERSTANSAGYDFTVVEDQIIPPSFVYTLSLGQRTALEKPTLVPTGIKAYMQPDEALFLYNRSSNPGKLGLVLANSVGVIDADYHSNPDNDGHIMFAFYNMSGSPVKLERGMKIGQGIFQKYLKVDFDASSGERKGGFGSTSI